MKRPSGEPLRVLYVQPAEGFGGAERQGVLHIGLLGRYGVEVVPVVGPGPQIVAELEKAGVADHVFLGHLTHQDESPSTAWGLARLAARAVRDFVLTQRSLLRVARERRVDLVFASRSPGWIAASGIAKLLRLPLVWRGGSRITHPAEALVMRVLSKVFGPDLLLANCEAVRRDLAPLVACPTRFLQNGVDTVRFDPERVGPRLRGELGFAAGVPIVGLPARPSPDKGLDFLARVVERTVRRVPAARFVVAGDFPWRRHYEELFAAQGLGERVRFVGHVPDVEGFLASCDAVVLTSKARSTEGSPNAVLEAMAMERPVVATDVGGVSEAVCDGREGFLLDTEDADGFASRLAWLLGDPALRRRMGTAGRAAIFERYHHERVVAELARLLHDVNAGARDLAAAPPRMRTTDVEADRPERALAHR